MSRRLELQSMLENLIGSRNVYFQPPSSVQMTYPCIVYERSYIDTMFANNNPYCFHDRYQVTVIDPDPDSEIPKRIAALSKCSFDRHFTADNLNHDVFNLYF